MLGGNEKLKHLLNVLFCNQNRQYKPVDITKIHINNFINFTKKKIPVSMEAGLPNDLGVDTNQAALVLGGRSPVAEVSSRLRLL